MDGCGRDLDDVDKSKNVKDFLELLEMEAAWNRTSSGAFSGSVALLTPWCWHNFVLICYDNPREMIQHYQEVKLSLFLSEWVWRGMVWLDPDS